MQAELIAFFGVLAAACAVNQISHLILEGSLFEGLRSWADQRDGFGDKNPGVFAAYTRGLFDCRLCFAQEVSVAVTWALLALAYSANSSLTTWQGWVAAVVFGPFVVAGADWLLNSCRER